MKKETLKIITIFVLTIPLVILCLYFVNYAIDGEVPNWLKDDSSNCGKITVCEKYNIDDYKCVRQGYTEKNWLGFTNWKNEYYNCEKLGTVIRSCIEWGNLVPSNLTSDYKYCKEIN